MLSFSFTNLLHVVDLLQLIVCACLCGIMAHAASVSNHRDRDPALLENMELNNLQTEPRSESTMDTLFELYSGVLEKQVDSTDQNGREVSL